MRVMRRVGVEGSVLGAGSPSGPRASSAVWLRFRSGWGGLLVVVDVVVVGFVGCGLTTAASRVCLSCISDGVLSGMEALALGPDVVGRSVISIVLLV